MTRPQEISKPAEQLLQWNEVWVRLGDLVPNPSNPKYSTDETVQRLNDSVDTLGQFETIAVDYDGVSAVDGHQRLNAWVASKGEDFKVRALQPSRKLTELEIRKIILLSGKGTHGQFDMELLRLNFDDVELMDFGGFTEQELEQIDPDAFKPSTEDDQGQLDELSPVYINCPHCGKEFNTREA